MDHQHPGGGHKTDWTISILEVDIKLIGPSASWRWKHKTDWTISILEVDIKLIGTSDPGGGHKTNWTISILEVDIKLIGPSASWR